MIRSAWYFTKFADHWKLRSEKQLYIDSSWSNSYKAVLLRRYGEYGFIKHVSNNLKHKMNHFSWTSRNKLFWKVYEFFNKIFLWVIFKLDSSTTTQHDMLKFNLIIDTITIPNESYLMHFFMQNSESLLENVYWFNNL